ESQASLLSTSPVAKTSATHVRSPASLRRNIVSPTCSPLPGGTSNRRCWSATGTDVAKNVESSRTCTLKTCGLLWSSAPSTYRHPYYNELFRKIPAAGARARWQRQDGSPGEENTRS